MGDCMQVSLDDLEVLDWDYTYLLGWYDAAGKAYLSTWGGSMPRVDAIVLNSSVGGPPLWGAVVPANCRAYRVPDGLGHEDRIALATRLGGVYAFGWRVHEPLTRSAP